MADVHLRLSRYEAQVLRNVLGDLATTHPQRLAVANDVWMRLGHLLAPSRAQVRRADRPRHSGVPLPTG